MTRRKWLIAILAVFLVLGIAAFSLVYKQYKRPMFAVNLSTLEADLNKIPDESRRTSLLSDLNTLKDEVNASNASPKDAKAMNLNKVDGWLINYLDCFVASGMIPEDFDYWRALFDNRHHLDNEEMAKAFKEDCTAN